MIGNAERHCWRQPQGFVRFAEILERDVQLSLAAFSEGSDRIAVACRRHQSDVISQIFQSEISVSRLRIACI